MNFTSTRFKLVVVLVLILIGLQPVMAQDDSISTLADGNGIFAFDLYHAIQEEADGNLFYSPYSISQALAMTYAGARGETARQMADTLHFILPQEELPPAFYVLDSYLTPPEDTGSVQGEEGQPFQLNISNALWGQEGYPFLEEFINLLSESYGAGLYPVDFENVPEEARQMVNDWVADETEDKIRDIVPPGAISSATRLVLANAIYFNAGWLFPFEESLTQDDVFTLLDGSQVTIPMMYQEESFGYVQGDGYQAVELSYYGYDMAMLIIVPDEGEFESFEESLNFETFTAIQSSITWEQVQLFMPTFEYEFDLGLSDILSSMGMSDAFDGATADFSGMTDVESLFISEVLHKAFIKVDEQGTEAAAATAVIMATTAMPMGPVEFRVDRPFIFTIYDHQTGSILFVGRVLNPVGE